MIKEFETYINESWFSKTFDERIDEIDRKLLLGRRYSAMIKTNSTKYIDDMRRAMKFFKYFVENLNDISSELNNIIKKYGKKLTQDQMDDFVKEFIRCVKMIKIGYYNLDQNSDTRNSIKSILENINSVLISLEFLSVEYGYNIDINFKYGDKIDFLVPIKDGNFYKIDAFSVYDEREEKIKKAHEKEDPFGEEDWDS